MFVLILESSATSSRASAHSLRQWRKRYRDLLAARTREAATKRDTDLAHHPSPHPRNRPRYPNTLENPSRLEALQQMLEHQPDNAFARYGLAMEHVRLGQFAEGVLEFEALLSAKPDYSAAYFHGGQTLEKLGDLDKARDWYRRGIAITRDPHTRSELQAALDILGD